MAHFNSFSFKPNAQLSPKKSTIDFLLKYSASLTSIANRNLHNIAVSKN